MIARIAAVLFAVFAVNTAMAEDGGISARLERSLSSLKSVRAEFVQELRRTEAGAPEIAKGTFTVKKPGRFRWDYTLPQQLIVCDGERLWMYDPELEQATVRKVRDVLAQTPAMILSGESRVADHYTVHGAGIIGGLEMAVLVPRQADGDFREIRIGLAGEEIRRLEFVDRLNQRTTVDLAKIERNPVLKDSMFTFTPPAGVDVIGAH